MFDATYDEEWRNACAFMVRSLFGSHPSWLVIRTHGELEIHLSHCFPLDLPQYMDEPGRVNEYGVDEEDLKERSP